MQADPRSNPSSGRANPRLRRRAPVLLIMLASILAPSLSGCDRAVDDTAAAGHDRAVDDTAPAGHDRAVDDTAAAGHTREQGATSAADDAGSGYVRESADGHFVVRLEPRDGKAPLRRLHEWIVVVENTAGAVVRPTRLALAAGMEQHGHGMETRPRVVEVLPDGRHVVGGMKFNMAGEWQVRVEIVDGSTADLARFDVVVTP